MGNHIDILKRALVAHVPERTESLNKKALTAGARTAKEYLEETR